MKVSIIVPVYNGEKYLNQCLDSLVNQTIDEFEIIVVNDASTDNTPTILKRYQQNHPNLFKVINLETNRRQGAARNIGIENASGEFIGFVDCDDFIDTTMYEKLYNIAIEDDADIVDCDYFHFFYKKGKKIHKKSNNINQSGILDKNILRSLILAPGRMWTKIFKRELWKDFRFPENLHYEDLVFPAIYMKAKRLSKIDEPLLYYRENSLSVTHTTDTFIDRVKTIEIMLTMFRKNKNYSEIKDEVEWLTSRLLYIKPLRRFLIEKKQLSIIIEYGSSATQKINNMVPNYRDNIYFKRSTVVHKVITKLADVFGFASTVIILGPPYRFLRKFL